jgi:hypothetical protein
VHPATVKKWTLCAAMASAVMFAAAAAVPVVSLEGCGANESIFCVTKDAGADDGGQGGAGGGVDESSSTLCP